MKREIHLGGFTIADLEALQDIKLEPGDNWVLKATPHNIEEPFSSGLLGKNGFLLLEVIGRIYARLNKTNPPKKVMVKEGEETIEVDVPFYGDHQFLETINIDYDTKTVELGFGS